MTRLRVEVPPEMLRWARERADVTLDALARPLREYPRWERGEISPTLKQLERFARIVHVPIGYLFLAEAPSEPLPIPDFRTIRDARLRRPSPDLLETIYLCQERQEWYREAALADGEEPLAFVGSARVTDDVVVTAAGMRERLAFDLEEREALRTWSEALSRFAEQCDAIGVLVMRSGIVGSQSRRRLDPDEFRGFALTDDVAPLVFVNAADTRAAQMFTLAHELAHIWLGKSALTDSQASDVPAESVERWCNRVAAELLVPLAVARREYRSGSSLTTELDRLARRFKVSTLVVLRRLLDAGHLPASRFGALYRAELERVGIRTRREGGDFYATLGARVGKRLARALVVSTLEGRTTFRRAFWLLGVRRQATFDRLSETLGVAD